MLVYRVVFPNNKSYIGQTTRDLEKRKQEHLSDLKRGCDSKFFKAIKKYGWESLEWKIICILNTADGINYDLLDETEIYWIKHFDSVKNGYNTSLGGKGYKGWTPNEHQRKMMSERFKGENNPAKRKEVRQKISNSWTKERKEKQRKLMSERMLGFFREKSSKEREQISIRMSYIMKKRMIEKCKDKDWVERRNKNVIKALNKPEIRKKRRNNVNGIKNPNFRWVYFFEKDGVILNTMGITLREFCENNKNLNFEYTVINYHLNTKGVYKGWKCWREKYEKLVSRDI